MYFVTRALKLYRMAWAEWLGQNGSKNHDNNKNIYTWINNNVYH